MKSKRKGFTLVELVAVLVILAILATIVTPLVLTLINKAKVSAFILAALSGALKTPPEALT